MEPEIPCTEECDQPVSLTDFLSPAERLIFHHLHRLEKRMSELIDQVDAALEQLAADDTAVAGVISAQTASIAVLEAALAASRAGEVANEQELQKALEALHASSASLGALIPAADAPSVPAPADPAPADSQATADPAPSDPVTVVGNTGDEAAVAGDGWTEGVTQIPSPTPVLRDGDTEVAGVSGEDTEALQATIGTTSPSEGTAPESSGPVVS